MRLLVAEDCSMLRNQLTTMISELGGIEIVGQEQEALAACFAINDLKPDVVILDILMRNGKGLEVLRKLKDGDCLPVMDDELVRKYVSVQPGAHVMLSISDTGLGMDAETLAHAFEPFFTTKGSGKGTGLGLATVYGIVKQSGGNIWLYSEVGKGTAVKIFLPRVDDVASDPEIAARMETIPRGCETLLLVEDDAQVRRIIREVLEQQGYQVLTAANGEDAFKLAGDPQTQIHLLLTDVVMPQMGGRELAEQLSGLRSELKILYMSGYTDDAIVRHGLWDEKLHVIQKPFDSATVLRKVREVLDSPDGGG